ncbi:MAG TPA: protein kinase [Acidimicrobiia bacterium]|nr:protein kinase [Acidimicrobiia bacterium]
MVQVVLTPVQNALPSYEIGGELGRGAMGIVLAGRHRQLDREVAIKQLPAAFAADEEVRQRFGHEARTLASLAHPHIVPVYDYVEREGLCLLVMESLPGGTLWDRFIGQGLTMATACTAVLATCAGLQFAHERGVLHRDVKPENLMFAADRTLKITDFGIAQVFGGDETVTTVDGAVIGTPAYMAPEQAEGAACGPTADVYATGTVLFELLSGSLPFSIEGKSVEVLERRVNEEPADLATVAPNVPAPLVEVTMRAIARKPHDRYQSAEEFGVALAEAATEAFGPGWLGRAELTLVATGPIAIAAGPATPPTDGSSDDAAGATAVMGRDASHRDRARMDELTPDDLVRIDDLIAPPKRPILATLASTALLAGLVVVSALGLGSADPPANTLRTGDVRVAGTDIATDERVDANLADEIPVRIDDLPAGAADAVYVRLGFSALGVQIPPSRSALLAPARGGGFEADIDAKRVRVLVSGKVHGELRFLDDRKRELRADEFGFESDRPFFLAANGLAGLLVLAFVLTYGWSLSLPLRRGKRRPTAHIAMAVLGGIAGAAVVDLGWALRGPQITWQTLVAGTAIGVVTFLAIAQATVMAGRRRRLVRARERKAEPPPDQAETIGAGTMTPRPGENLSRAQARAERRAQRRAKRQAEREGAGPRTSRDTTITGSDAGPRTSRDTTITGSDAGTPPGEDSPPDDASSDAEPPPASDAEED